LTALEYQLQLGSFFDREKARLKSVLWRLLSEISRLPTFRAHGTFSDAPKREGVTYSQDLGTLPGPHDHSDLRI